MRDGALRGRHHAARQLGIRGGAGARAALEEAANDVAARASSEPGAPLAERDNRLLTEAVRALLRMERADSTLTLFDRLLRHGNREVKWPLLKNPPADAELVGGMRYVAAEKWGWQERTARDWLAGTGPRRSSGAVSVGGAVASARAEAKRAESRGGQRGQRAQRSHRLLDLRRGTRVRVGGAPAAISWMARRSL